MEIEEDNAKLEEYRQIAAPVAARRRGVAARRRRRACRRAARAGRARRAAPRRRARPGAQGKPPASVHQAMGWDDEELDTQIFDKEEVKPVAAEDLFFEDDDRTVANEPAPDILEQARPPELQLTPKPIELTPLPSEDIKMTPPPLARPLPPPPARAAADAGRRSAGRHAAARRAGRARCRRCRRPGRRPGRAGLRRSSMNMQPPVAPAPPPRAPAAHADADARRCRAAGSRPQRFHAPHEAPFGTGSFETVPAEAPGAARGLRAARGRGGRGRRRWSTGTTATSNRGGSS